MKTMFLVIEVTTRLACEASDDDSRFTHLGIYSSREDAENRVAELRQSIAAARTGAFAEPRVVAYWREVPIDASLQDIELEWVEEEYPEDPDDEE